MTKLKEKSPVLGLKVSKIPLQRDSLANSIKSKAKKMTNRWYCSLPSSSSLKSFEFTFKIFLKSFHLTCFKLSSPSWDKLFSSFVDLAWGEKIPKLKSKRKTSQIIPKARYPKWEYGTTTLEKLTQSKLRPLSRKTTAPKTEYLFFWVKSPNTPIKNKMKLRAIKLFKLSILFSY